MSRYSIDGQILTDIADVTRKATGTELVIFHTDILKSAPGITGYDETRSEFFGDPYTDPWAKYNQWTYMVYDVPKGEKVVIHGALKGAVYDKDQLWIAEGNQQVQNPENVIINIKDLASPYMFEFIATTDQITIGGYYWLGVPSFYIEVDVCGAQKYTPEEMVTVLNSISILDGSLLNLTGPIDYKFYQGRWDNFVNLYGDKITTENITNVERAFQYSEVKRILFEINCDNKAANISMANMCNYASNLTEPPIFNNCKPGNMTGMFQQCRHIRYFPEGYGEDWDWSWHTSQTGSSNGQKDGIFQSCYSLRRLPMGLWKYGNPNLSATYTPLRNIYTLYALDEMVDIPFPHTSTANSTNSSMIFYNSFKNMSRIKNFTFASDIGAKQWAKQTLDFTTYFGWVSSPNDVIKYNSGITLDKRVEDDATYQALKNDPDWFTTDMAYSRYNHDSAVATINSLPDCSAYVATVSGGANIIKFKGAAGEKTDGGAINTLTDEEIAVAAAKGWTVSIV